MSVNEAETDDRTTFRACAWKRCPRSLVTATPAAFPRDGDNRGRRRTVAIDSSPIPLQASGFPTRSAANLAADRFDLDLAATTKVPRSGRTLNPEGVGDGGHAVQNCQSREGNRHPRLICHRDA